MGVSVHHGPHDGPDAKQRLDAAMSAPWWGSLGLHIYNEIILKHRWEDIPDYLLAYQSYLRARDEYLVEKGLKPPSVLQKDLYTGFYNKMANSINDNMYAFQQARSKYQGNFYPIALPM